MNISVVETNRGQKSIIWDGYRYRLHGTLKTGDISWPCAKSKPPCKARIRIDAECLTVISQKNEHSHPQDEQKQRGTTSDIEPRRRQQKTHVLSRQKSYVAKSRLLKKKHYSLMIYRATGKGLLMHELSNLCPG